MKTCANSAVLKSARTSGPRVAWTKRNYCTLSRDAVKPRVVSKGCTCARPQRCRRDLRDVLQGCGWSECKEGAGVLCKECRRCSGALQGLTVHLIAYMHGLKIYGSLIYRSARENCIMSEMF